MESKNQNMAFLSDENWMKLLGIPHRHYTATVRCGLETTREKSACD